MKNYNITDWLPTSKEELQKRKWDYVDVIIISGDSYVDHPSFGASIIGRVIENEGYRVAILPQPNWRDDLRDFKKLGVPRLFFGITAGNMDSMVNHYTANKRLRSDDAYTSGNKSGFRPDYATVVYSKILRSLFPETPIIIGGIEASMRRLTHYDYWSNSIKPDILTWSDANLLVFGNGEKPIIDILNKLNNGNKITDIQTVEQTAFRIKKGTYLNNSNNWHTIILPSHQECVKSKIKFSEHFKVFEQESNKWQGSRLIEENNEWLTVINPPSKPMNEDEIDKIYSLSFTYLPHPRYTKRGIIPAYEMIKHSVNSHRGCFGGCSFCTISAHQGKFIVSRSENSIINEIKKISNLDDFKGHITDLGGPSANMYKMCGFDLEQCKKCGRASCIFPAICKNLNYNHTPITNLYKKAESVTKVKHITIGSGIRYDILVKKTSEENIKNGLDKYIEQVVNRHVSGRLKVAPEHTSTSVLNLMRKTDFNDFIAFKKKIDEINKANKLNQQLIPYFISSHPACKIEDMADLAIKTKELGYKLEQIQDFTPTPMTLSTTIYYTGIDPYSKKNIYTAKNQEDKLNQRLFFFWYKSENKMKILKLLQKIKRKDIANKIFSLKHN